MDMADILHMANGALEEGPDENPQQLQRFQQAAASSHARVMRLKRKLGRHSIWLEALLLVASWLGALWLEAL